MPHPRLHVVYDYVDPGSYLVSELLGRWAEGRAGSPEVTWSPLELRLPGRTPVDPRAPEWERLCGFLESEAREAGVPLRWGGPVPWTRKAHELALHAREKGCFDPIHRAIFRAHFEEERDIGRVDVLLELASGAGLDPGEVRTVLGVDRFRPEIEEIRAGLLERGIPGVPVVEADGRRLEGFPDVEGFRAFLREVAPHRPAKTEDH